MDKIFGKYRQAILYLFFGALSFGVNVSVFASLHMVAQMDELAANVISWVATVLFVFFTNRVWVFDAPTKTAKDFLSQLSAFLGGRLATLILEEGGLFVCVRLLHLPSMEVKLAAQVMVILSNYAISKMLVFQRRGTDREDGEHVEHGKDGERGEDVQDREDRGDVEHGGDAEGGEHENMGESARDWERNRKGTEKKQKG